MTWRPNATVACIVEQDGRFLFVEEGDPRRSVLNQPAGHLEPEESLLAAAIRETQEESAWQVELHAVVGIYRWCNPASGITYLRTTFAAHPIAHNPKQKLDRGIIGTHWLSRQELEQQWGGRLRSPTVMHSLNDYLNGQLFPLSLIQDL